MGHFLEQVMMKIDVVEISTAVFTDGRWKYLSTILAGQKLSAIAHPQKWKLTSEGIGIHIRRTLVPNGAGGAGKNDSFDVSGVFRDFIVRVNFTVYVQFADSTGDELGVLRTEIED
jgi:hypothetical protein